MVDRVPEKLKGNYWYILELCFYGWIAKLLSDFLNTTFNSTLWSTSITGIVVGILAAALGIIDTSPMNKAQSYGFLNWALTAYFMSFLKTATAQSAAFAGCAAGHGPGAGHRGYLHRLYPAGHLQRLSVFPSPWPLRLASTASWASPTILFWSKSVLPRWSAPRSARRRWKIT